MVSKIEALTDKWSKQRMTLKGRRLIVSFLMQSKAQYMLSTNDTPSDVIARIAKAAHQVMWAGKKRGITTMDVVERPIVEGGLGVPNFILRARTARIISAKKWCAPLDARPLWADMADDLIRLSSKRPDDPRQKSVLWQTWKETLGKTSKLPRDLQAMLKELRRYDIRTEALKLSDTARNEAPVWLSRSTNISAKEENSAPMRLLRKQHHIQDMGDLLRISRNNAAGCKKHHECVKAVELIHQRTNPRQNVRFVTLFLQGANTKDDLDFTPQRRRKAEEDKKAGRPTTIDPTFTESGSLRHALRIFGKSPEPNTLPAFREGQPPSRDREIVVWTDGSATHVGTSSERIGFGVYSKEPSLCASSRMLSPPLTNNRAELAAVVWTLSRAQANIPIKIHMDSQYVITGLTSTIRE